MKVIRIDEDVWAGLQKKAQPFEDTPNSVLRRLLGLDRANGKKRVAKSLPRGVRTAESEFRDPLLRVLHEAGGSARTSEALDRVGDLMGDRLNDADRRVTKSGAIRWRNTTQWARDAMVREGLLKDNSPRGV